MGERGTFGKNIDPVEAGRKGGQTSAATRRAIRAQDPVSAMRELLSGKRNRFAKELTDAALGEGRWAPGEDCKGGLPLEKQLDALKVALAYAIGRPSAVRAPAEPDPDDEPEGPPVEEDPIFGLPESPSVGKDEE